MKTKNTFYAKYGKRWFDLLLTIPGFVVIFPLLGLIALLVRFQLGSPVLFHQKRPGLHSKPFGLIKFRTMTNACDGRGNLLPNAARMTKFGTFLRTTSIDELPELFNVVKGDMSLVGPRPLLMDYLPYYDEKKNGRHEIRPGITGWTQVNGRNALGWEEKFELDAWYVNHCSFSLDLKILFLTAWKVLRRDGIVHEGDVAMPRFDDFIRHKKQQQEKR